MDRMDRAKRTPLSRLWREPTLHFFAIGAAVLVAHRLAAGDPRTIVITPALESDLLRRYHDQLNRAPTSAEADAFMQSWKADEALYREALREGIDREDMTVRNVLISKMRERLMLQARLPEPTEADLQRYLDEHRDQFETPLMYEHQYVAFPKTDPHAAEERRTIEQKLTSGATPASLGLRSMAANVTRERIEAALGPETADAICHLPLGRWQELETKAQLLLVELISVQGGLPEPKVLHERLVAGWKAAQSAKALATATRALTGRYRFEEPPR